MEKLNELVELGKKATGGEWATDARNAVVALDDRANSGFVICAASGCDKASNAAFIAAANPETILAIADAFRALERERNDYRNKFLDTEQRAEAAEAENRNYSELLSYHIDRQAKAEAKLAELEKQEPVAEVNHDGTFYGFKALENMPEGYYQLFTRPAPAINLAELVPKIMTWSYHDNVTQAEVAMWNACRAAILRKIEEAKC